MKLICIILLALWFPLPSVQAAKPRVRTAPVKRAAGVSYVTVKKSKPTNSLQLMFSNLGNVMKASYEVQYNSSKGTQGVVGSFTPASQTDLRDVYLGTCSKGVCTPHSGVRSIVVVTRITIKSGGVYTKVSRASVF